jgi:transposase-like protein
MPKSSENEMCAEYDFSKLKGGMRGKYYSKAKAGTNLVLIDPDIAKVFPNDESVNRALRLLLETASDATKTPHSTRKKVKKKPNPRPKGASRIPTSR